MPLFHIVILALVQGITEFLPISSSGHLVLTHRLLGDTDLAEDRMMDIAVHVGTLFAVLLYYRRDVAAMLRGLIRPAESGGRRLFAQLCAASAPVIAAGLALHVLSPGWLDSPAMIGWTTLLFGIVLWAADRFRPMDKTLDGLGLKDALLIGAAQVLALIPGTSRSGITMTAARALGYSRTESAHFSLLLALVAIAGAGALAGLDIVRSGNVVLTLSAAIAAVLSFASSLAVIALMMRWLAHAGFAPFALYRVLLGIVLLGLVYGGALAP